MDLYDFISGDTDSCVVSKWMIELSMEHDGHKQESITLSTIGTFFDQTVMIYTV